MTDDGDDDDIYLQPVDPREMLTTPELSGLLPQDQPTEETVARWVATVARLDEWWQETSPLLVEMVKLTSSLHRRLMDNLPTNWPRDGSRLNNSWQVLQDGIPIAYVPRAEIVHKILEEDAYEDRARVVADNRLDIADDCRAALDSRTLHYTVADLSVLIDEAVAVLVEGRFASAQSLAVNIADNIVRRTMDPKWKYGRIVATIKDSRFEDELTSVALAFQPTLRFYEFWRFGGTPPRRLNRHRTAHWLTPEHVTEANATASVMLATSLLLAVTDWRNWIDSQNAQETL
ncbi:hypothetical protein [Mycolicibacterium vinylchloridicum]|uniref:hypothetical protein n=1 Tax=Mycolicibacterium vinylchloridicum TaxID=2736928 RepID=UPI0015C9A6BD|nr:hypothetical protein [Mycolicibacterium vinylchloridicum]